MLTELTCSNSVIANFWCGMQCLAVQMSSFVSSEMWKWIRMSRFSYPERKKKKYIFHLFRCEVARVCFQPGMSRIFCTRALLLRAAYLSVSGKLGRSVSFIHFSLSALTSR